MSSDKAPQGEGIFGGLLSLFWNKKAAPSSNSTGNNSATESSKAFDYITWSDNAIKKCTDLITILEDRTAPSSRLVASMNEFDAILQTDHEFSSVRIKDALFMI